MTQFLKITVFILQELNSIRQNLQNNRCLIGDITVKKLLLKPIPFAKTHLEGSLKLNPPPHLLIPHLSTLHLLILHLHHRLLQSHLLLHLIPLFILLLLHLLPLLLRLPYLRFSLQSQYCLYLLHLHLTVCCYLNHQ